MLLLLLLLLMMMMMMVTVTALPKIVRMLLRLRQWPELLPPAGPGLLQHLWCVRYIYTGAAKVCRHHSDQPGALLTRAVRSQHILRLRHRRAVSLPRAASRSQNERGLAFNLPCLRCR